MQTSAFASPAPILLTHDEAPLIRIGDRACLLVMLVGLFALVPLLFIVGERLTPGYTQTVLGIAHKVIPLGAITALGFFAGKLMDPKDVSFGGTIVYLIAPVVFLGAVVNAPLSRVYLLLPVLFFALPAAIFLLSRCLAASFLGRSEGHMAAFMAGTANGGVFGIPAAIAILPAEAMGAYMLCLLGSAIYENSLGYYVVARGKVPVRESILRTARLPAVYAIVLGLGINWVGLKITPELNGVWEAFKGSYVVLGMLTIGISAARAHSISSTVRFASVTLLSKMLFWPAVALSLVFLDANFTFIFSRDVHQIMLLFAALPCATCGAVYASQLEYHPEKAAIAVISTTLVAFLLVPLLPALA